MDRRPAFSCRLALAVSLLVASAGPAHALDPNVRIVAWNNLGMHCTDADFQIFSLLPPYNTVLAQVMRNGMLVTNASGLVVTYRGVADPTGSINTTSLGKLNFWDWALPLYGVALAPDQGLAGARMPGPTNLPQPMQWDAARNGFVAEGIPITPYDDALQKNTYPVMRVAVSDQVSGVVLAQTDVVLPVSDEMSCSGCHASGARGPAKPNGGWVFDPDPQRDFRLNILRLHDESNASDPSYAGLLTTRGYRSDGLFPTAQADGQPILCAGCHASNALPGTGLAGVLPLTEAIHARHANVRDLAAMGHPKLDDETNRAACYNCHPGSTTRCLRGAMGAAVATDGTLAMQCQSCHGRMSEVGAPGRVGWLDEPSCQACHTGTATTNAGALRFTSVFDAPGHVRIPADAAFATNPNVPSAGFSLYRFSTGHGGLECESCHGATHAEYPSSHANDNLQSVALQGHAGVLSQCNTCHTNGVPSTVSGGPHGLHPIGQSWVGSHGDAVGDEGGVALTTCTTCHGADYRGTVLSRSQADRMLSTDKFGTKHFWRGYQVSCFSCHNGPFSESASSNHPAQVTDALAATDTETPVAIPLGATDADGDPLVLRIVSQPVHGTVGLSGAVATYYPEAGQIGTERFTFAANDGSTDSNLAQAQVAVPEPSWRAAEFASFAALLAIALRRRRHATDRVSCPG